MLDDAVTRFLRDSGLAPDPARVTMTPLAGGVASDIWRVDAPGQTFVIKRALPKLRVAQDWSAPVSRNASEVGWMREAARVAPGAAPRILAHDAEAGLFAMTYFEPARYLVWKEELRAGRADPAFAARVGQTLAAIHAATAWSERVARRFANDATFHAIRIEPYILATARVHADLAAPLRQLAEDTLAAKHALVHGDVSPKNILAGPDGPVLLDAECAWFGESAFDLAFVLNHLLLKCLLTPPARAGFLASFDALASSYLAGVAWEPPRDVEARAARLLPALLLARVDGKSPVEYITAGVDKDRVRRAARPHIVSPPIRLAAIRDAWSLEFPS